MHTRPIAAALALALGALGTTLAPPADACGPVSVEDRVEWIVQDHFAAINAHDRDRLLSLWNEHATVVSEGEPTLVEPIDRAATRWLTAKRPVTFEIASVEPGDHSAIAHVNVVFDGKKLADTILFKETGRNTWQMAGKSSRPRGPASNAPAVRY